MSKNSSAKYYQENQGKKRKRKKKQQYGRQRCKNLSESEKQHNDFENYFNEKYKDVLKIHFEAINLII